MTYDWQTDLRPRRRTAAALLPPPTVEETAWDILLALHSDRECKISLAKLTAIASVPPQVLTEWLANLEDRQLISGVSNEVTREVRAALTGAGRALLDRYLSATNDLHVSGRH